MNKDAAKESQNPIAPEEKSSLNNNIYFAFFEYAPISLWIEDFSIAKKHIDELVAKSKTDIKSYIEANPDIISELALLVNIKNVNKAAVTLYKAKSKEDLLTNLEKIFTPSANKCFGKLLKNLLLGKTETEIETENVTFEGKIIQALVKFKIAEGSEESLENVIVSVEDITDRKKAKTEALDSEYRYKEAQSIAKIGSWFYNFETDESHWSDEVYKTFGLVLGKDFMNFERFISFVHVDDRALAKVFSIASFLKNPVQNIHYRIITVQGELKYISEIRRAVIENQRIVKFIGIGQDITERVLAEHHLNETQNLLSNTLSSVKDGLVMLDRNSNYTFVNEKGAELLNKNAQQLIGKNIWSEFSKRPGDSFYDNYQKAVKTGKPRSFENYFETWNRWFENRIIPSKEGMLIFFNEITDKKVAENKIKAAYNIINKSSSVAILCENKWDFPIVFASENAINLFGYSHTELLSGNIKLYQLFHLDDIAWVSEAFLKFLKEEDSNELKLPPIRIFTKNKEIKWIRGKIDVIRNSANEVTHIQGISEDITDQKNTEESNRKHLLAIEQSANIITISNSEGILEYFNPKFTEVYGFTKEEALGKTFSILKSGEHLEKFYFQMWQAIKSGEIWKGKLHNKAKNGKLIWIQQVITPVKNDAGKIVNYISISEDITEQKKVEDLYFESNQRVKDQFNHMPLASIIWDTDFKVLEWNNSAERIFGFTAEEAKRMNVKDLLTPPHIADEIDKIRKDAIEEKGGHKSTNQNLTKSGKIITCDWYNITLKDASGNIIGMASLADDITERMVAKKQLEKSEEKYRSLFEKSFDAVLILKDGFIADCNKAALKMFGYKDKPSLLKKHPSQLSPKIQDDGINSLTKSDEMINMALEKGGCRFIWDHQQQNGLVFPAEVSLTSIKESDSPSTTIHAVVRDVTENVKKERLEDVLFNISKAALTIVDFKEFSFFVRNELHKIIDTNNFFIAMYNPETEMLNTPVFVDDKEFVEEFSAKNSLTGYIIRTKKSLFLHEKAYLDFIKNKGVDLIGELSKIWMGVPLLIKDECIGAIVVQSYENENAYHKNDVQLLEFVADQISTIIQRKNIENELNKALTQAQESDRLKSAFLANMSHEIRTPMNGIIGFSEFFLDPNITKDKQREYAEIIIRSSKRLLSIVNDILDISKIEAGAVTLDMESVNLNKSIDELFDFYIPIAKEHHLELICKKGLENYKSVIETDKTKLNQVLSNLLSNAFKFTEKGSVEFGYQLDGNNLQFYVKDSGIGIEDNFQNTIFNRFTQGIQNISKQHKGTGLGLAITKKIVELFDGEIWIDSGNKGTTVYFTIPFRKSKVPQILSVIEEQKPTTPVKNKMLTILVAEDEEYNMMYITELFSSTNYTIIEADNGKRALELAQKHPEIDLVLMDIKMPIMDGTEAMKEIKKFNPTLPIIALSAFAMESDKESALKSGFNAYLTKPLDRKLLFKLIDDHSSKR